jgi:hypothetical protein
MRTYSRRVPSPTRATSGSGHGSSGSALAAWTRSARRVASASGRGEGDTEAMDENVRNDTA